MLGVNVLKVRKALVDAPKLKLKHDNIRIEDERTLHVMPPTGEKHKVLHSIQVRIRAEVLEPCFAVS